MAGLVGGLVAGLSADQLISEHYIMTETLFTFLLAAALSLFLVGLRRDRSVLFICAGLTVGLAALVRPPAQALVALCLLAAVVGFRRGPRVARGCLLVALAAVPVIVPWAVRNLAVHGIFTASGGIGHHLTGRMVANGGFVFSDPDRRPVESDLAHQEARDLIQNWADARVYSKSGFSASRVHEQLRRDFNVTDAQSDALMWDIGTEALRARPLAYIMMIPEDIRLIFVGQPELLRYHWDLRDRVTGPVTGPLRPLVLPASAEQKQQREFTQRLLDIYQGPRLGLLLPAFSLAGLVAAAIVPAWRAGLAPGLAVLGLILASVVLTGGEAARFHYPIDSLVHVVAVGGVLLVARSVRGALVRCRAGRPGG
jgi:hypothetical protein